MKPIHEIAVIKNGNEISGFVLAHEKDLVDVKKVTYSYVNIVSIDKMNRLVQENKVQYFVWDKDKNRLAIKYTQEELDWINKTVGKAGQSLIKTTSNLRDYVKNDVILKMSHVKMVMNKVGVAGALLNSFSMPLVGSVYGIMLFGDNDFGSMLNTWLNNQDDMVRKQITPVSIQRNNAIITVSERVYVKLAYALNICTNVNINERDKPSGLIKFAYGSQKSMLQAYNKIEPLNKKILEIAHQGL